MSQRHSNSNKAQHTLSPQERWAGIIAVLGLITIYSVSQGYKNTFFAISLELRGETNFMIGLNSVGQGAAMIAMAIVLPFLMKRFRLVALIAMAVLVEVFSLFALVLSDAFWVWFLMRVIIGFSTSVVFVTSSTLLGNLTFLYINARIMAVYTVCIGIGLTLGPLLLRVLDVQQAIVLYMPALLVLVCLLPVAMLTVRIEPTSEAETSPEKASARLNVFNFALIAPIVTFCFILIGIKDIVQYNFLTVYALSRGLTVDDGLFLLSVSLFGGMSVPLLFGVLGDRWGIRYVLSTLFILFGVLFLVLDAVIESAYSRYAVVFLLGGVGGSIYGLTIALIRQEFSTAYLSVCFASAEIYWGGGAQSWAQSVWAPFLIRSKKLRFRCLWLPCSYRSGF